MTSKILFNNSKEHHLDQDCPEGQASLGVAAAHLRPLTTCLTSPSAESAQKQQTPPHSPTGVTRHLASSGKGSSMTHNCGVGEL